MLRSQLDRLDQDHQEALITIDSLQAANAQLSAEVAELKAASLLQGRRARMQRAYTSGGEEMSSSPLAREGSEGGLGERSREATGPAQDPGRPGEVDLLKAQMERQLETMEGAEARRALDHEVRSRRVVELEELLDEARDEIGALQRTADPLEVRKDLVQVVWALDELQGAHRQVRQ